MSQLSKETADDGTVLGAAPPARSGKPGAGPPAGKGLEGG